jgi:hypothetical protein
VAALLRFAAVVTALAALFYFEVLALLVTRGSTYVEVPGSGTSHELTVAQAMLAIGPAFIGTVFLTYQILGPRSRLATALALGAWYAITLLHAVVWTWYFNVGAEVGAIALVAIVVLRLRSISFSR